MAGNEFSYGAYVVFVLAVGTISVFYRLAYAAWYPDLIPRGAEQRGYAVSSALYPFITVVAAPAAAFLYERAEMEHLLFLAGALTLLSVAVESLIAETGVRQGERYPFRQYLQDIREGFSYLKKEKGYIYEHYEWNQRRDGCSGAGIFSDQSSSERHDAGNFKKCGDDRARCRRLRPVRSGDSREKTLCIYKSGISFL